MPERAVRCHRCGDEMVPDTLADIWEMLIDRQLHRVPVCGIPCVRCEKCNVGLLTAGSDAVIQRCYDAYMDENNLNTPYLRFRRYIRQAMRKFAINWRNYWSQIKYHKL